MSRRLRDMWRHGKECKFSTPTFNALVEGDAIGK